jgi:hypothetical protein
MAVAPPRHDSVIDALGYAVRVLGKPEFLWAPFILYVILLLPLLAFPVTAPTITTQAEADAFFRGLVPVVLATLVVSLVLGPLASAVMYRLAQQYVDGQSAAPFEPGIVRLAWRFFLQGLAILLVAVVASIACVLVFAILQAIVGTGAALFFTLLGGLAAGVYLALRLGLAPVLLLWDLGPIEAFGRSWALTRGQLGRVFRWLVVSGAIIGIGGAVISGVVTAFFGIFGQVAVGQYLGTLLVAPVGVVSSIVLVLLARLLSSPEPTAPRPTAALPDWMQQGGPPAEPPTSPPPAPPTSEG